MFNADGNQTLIKTSTGVWSVTYNAENRPVRWESGDTVITMNFDRLGRRVFYKEEVNGVVTKHHRFVYDNYLCVQKVDALNNNAQINLFVWDPTEPVATRPLFTTGSGNRKFFYTCDGNKNVSELVHFETRNGIAAHYDYAPFGAVTRAISASAITDNTFTTDNPFRFSSEYHDDTLGLVYYNYRHYNPIDGRWCGRDYAELLSLSLYNFAYNSFYRVDILGLVEEYKVLKVYENIRNCLETCPYLMNWGEGLKVLDEYLAPKTSFVLSDINDGLKVVNNFLSKAETLKESWNLLAKDHQVNITFEKISAPLEKVIDYIDATDIFFKLEHASDLSPADQVILLNDIIELTSLSANVPILSEYISNSLSMLGEALKSIENIHDNSFFSSLLMAEDCSMLMQMINGPHHSNLAKTLQTRMRKQKGAK